METKLTLRLKESSIKKAKSYAKNHKLSVSKMVDAYFESLEQNPAEAEEISELVKSLSGIISLETDFDYKASRADALEKKHQ